MDVTIETSDPESVQAEWVADVLQDAGWFVGSVTVNVRETADLGSSWQHRFLEEKPE